MMLMERTFTEIVAETLNTIAWVAGVIGVFSLLVVIWWSGRCDD
jgi:hypothetical protein